MTNEQPTPPQRTACDHDLPSSWGDLLPLLSDTALRELERMWGNYVPHDDRDTEMHDDLVTALSKRDRGLTGARYVVLLGVSQVAQDDGVLHASSFAAEISAAHPTRVVRMFDTQDDRLVCSYRAGEALTSEN
jgi:hypothetical protein